MAREKVTGTGYKFGDLQKYKEKSKLPVGQLTINFPIHYGRCSTTSEEQEELKEFMQGVAKLLGVKLQMKTKNTKDMGIVDVFFHAID